MSDLTATHCGCNSTPSCGGNNSCNFIWIILLLSCFCGGEGGSILGGGGCGGGCGGGNDSCSWLIWILLISCLCGGNGSGLGLGCGC